MSKWWKGAALAALWFSPAAVLLAQSPPPSPPPTRLPEPVPSGMGLPTAQYPYPYSAPYAAPPVPYGGIRPVASPPQPYGMPNASAPPYPMMAQPNQPAASPGGQPPYGRGGPPPGMVPVGPSNTIGPLNTNAKKGAMVPDGTVVPGPLNSDIAPPGPEDDMALPASIPTAWDGPCIQENNIYVHLGAMALRRQGLGNSVFLFHDNATNLDTGTVPRGATSPAAAFNSVDPRTFFGVRATVGYLFAGGAIEASGFFLPQSSWSSNVVDPGRLNLLFHNPPLGFEGDNGMWLNADHVRTTLTNTLANGEVNYRWWSQSHTGIEGILGIRYLDVQDQLSIFTDDDGLTRTDVNGNPDPNRQATYSVRAHNRIIGPQFGFDWTYSLIKWMNVGFMAKGVLGVNLLEVDTRLQRGDGYMGINSRDQRVTFGNAYELNAYVDLIALERLRLRAGYMCLWVVNVGEATQQINYDLSQPTSSNIRDNGSIFYHGPMIEFQFLF